MSDEATSRVDDGRKIEIQQWKASDLEMLIYCLRELIPGSFDPSLSGRPPRFQEQEVSAQEAGWGFEHWICEAFRLSTNTAIVEESLKVPLYSSRKTQEEIDGLVTLGWQGFLIQCKLESASTSFDPIARLHLQVERRPIGTMGLFFSRDYSDSAIELAAELRPIRVLLFRVEGIVWELKKERSFDMLKLVEKKWRAAMHYARPDWNTSTIPD
jgi:hypothetical protein